MVAFTHDQQSTAEGQWLAAPGMTAMSSLEIDWSRLSRLIVVSAHPDDETLGAAGLLQRATELGVPIDVIVATWGEKSHPDSPTHSASDLTRVRAAELKSALDILAPASHHRVLGIPDGHVASNMAVLEAAISAAAGPGGRTLIVAPWSADGHTDHDAAGTAAANAARTTGSLFLEYPIWMWHWGQPNALETARDVIPWPAFRRLDLSDHEKTAKITAMASHVSQVRPLSPAPEDAELLSAGMLSHFQRSFETFIDVAGRFVPSDSAAVGWVQQQFDVIHAAGAEPWNPPAWYEQRKRALLLAGLDRAHFDSGLELGCSTGALLEELAPRCAQLLGLDASGEAVESARRRTAHLPAVTCRHSVLPADWPVGKFDLFVLSETGYYFSAAGLSCLVDHLIGSALPGATLVACHWRHPIVGWPLDGADVHGILRGDDRLELTGTYLEEDFMLDFFRIGRLP